MKYIIVSAIKLFFVLVAMSLLFIGCTSSSRSTFYGLERGNPPHAVLIDISGSMGDGAGDTIESSAARDAINAANRSVGRINTGSALANNIANKVRGSLLSSARKQTTKLAESQRQLIPFIRSLPEGTLFNAMAFNNSQVQAASTMMKATGDSKESAIRFVRELEAYGGTRMLPALETAIQQNPSTIYLVTDGRPNDSQSLILKVVERAAARGIVIHTIGVGKDQNKAFLSQIAEITGGVFTSQGNSIPILRP